jgi:hypothetical protein
MLHGVGHHQAVHGSRNDPSSKPSAFTGREQATNPNRLLRFIVSQNADRAGCPSLHGMKQALIRQEARHYFFKVLDKGTPECGS